MQPIQSVANLKWPASDPANRAIRDEFRLGMFPPSGGKKGKQPQAPAPAPTPRNNS